MWKCRDHAARLHVGRARRRARRRGHRARDVDAGIPDAILCHTGRQAAGVLTGLTARGVAVPDRTMLAAASDSEHTRHSRPAISAVELHAGETTLALLDLLQARIAGEPSAGPVLTTARFRVRASSRRTGTNA
ncbi:substrate-binding domain-containing protein [Streptomyces sp. NPDC007920]|uniref:substrate-binding domain-containing protein n=1 Tax=unclassified Streptomyces TaxID=2593676 RepID=UPI0036EB841F